MESRAGALAWQQNGRWEGRVRNVHRTKIDGLLYTATAAVVAVTNVLTEVLDLISTEQMTELDRLQKH